MKGILKLKHSREEEEKGNHSNPKMIKWDISTQVHILHEENVLLERAIEKGNLGKIKNILDHMDDTEIQKFILDGQGVWVWLLLINVNDKSKLKIKYNGEAFKDIIDIFMTLNHDIVIKSYGGFRAHLMRNHEKVDAQVIEDYLEVDKAFKASQNGNLHRNLDLESSSEKKISDMNDAIDDSSSKETIADSQRSSTEDIVASDELDNAEEEWKCIIIEDTGSSFSGIILRNFYFWLHELSEALQKYFLSTATIVSLIETAEQVAAIYDIKSIAQDFARKMLLPKTTNDSVNAVEDDIDEKAVAHVLVFMESIDMNLVLNDPAVGSCILPMVGIESGNIFGANSAFNGSINFNIQNAIDVF